MKEKKIKVIKKIVVVACLLLIIIHSGVTVKSIKGNSNYKKTEYNARENKFLSVQFDKITQIHVENGKDKWYGVGTLTDGTSVVIISEQDRIPTENAKVKGIFIINSAMLNFFKEQIQSQNISELSGITLDNYVFSVDDNPYNVKTTDYLFTVIGIVGILAIIGWRIIEQVKKRE